MDPLGPSATRIIRQSNSEAPNFYLSISATESLIYLNNLYNSR